MGVVVGGGRRVHVRDRDGRLVFTRLWDRGEDVLEFDSGHGRVCKRYHAGNGWTTHDGWPATEADLRERAARVAAVWAENGARILEALGDSPRGEALEAAIESLAEGVRHSRVGR